MVPVTCYLVFVPLPMVNSFGISGLDHPVSQLPSTALHLFPRCSAKSSVHHPLVFRLSSWASSNIRLSCSTLRYFKAPKHHSETSSQLLVHSTSNVWMLVDTHRRWQHSDLGHGANVWLLGTGFFSSYSIIVLIEVEMDGAPMAFVHGRNVMTRWADCCTGTRYLVSPAVTPTRHGC